MTTVNNLGNGLAGTTGTGNFVGSTSPALTTPKVITSINDTNANELIKVVATASAVNEVTVANQATGQSPSISATGDDTNIVLVLNGKGTGGAAVLGTSTNNNAATGYVGEFVSSVISEASGVNMPDVTATNITSISLTAGDWDVWGNVTSTAITVGLAYQFGWISSTSATLPDGSLYANVIATITAPTGMCVPAQRFSLSGTTTIYLSGQFDLTGGTAKGCGGIYARRVR